MSHGDIRNISSGYCLSFIRKIAGDRLKDEKGIALMMVLWVMILLGFIALEFAHSMRTEVEVTKNFRDEIQAYYLANAGIEIGRYELAVSAKARPHYRDAQTGKLVFGKGDDDAPKPPPACRVFDLGEGTCSYDFETVKDKLPLNKLADPARHSQSVEMIKSFLDKYCEVDIGSEEWSNISLAIMDWVDEDHIAGGSIQTGGAPDLGAEDDWYKSHDQGYECKDAPFESEAELGMIRGLRPERGDGEEEAARKKKIVAAFKRYFKVELDWEIKPQAQVFYNTASEDVAQVAYDIGWPGSVSPDTVSETRERNGGIYDPGFGATYYTIVSTAVMKGSPVQRKIKASFLQIDASPTRTYWKPLSWNDNFIPEYSEDPNQTDDAEGSDQPVTE